MVSKAPYLLNFDVKRLDNRLGFYQQQLKLNASNVRNSCENIQRDLIHQSFLYLKKTVSLHHVL